jgi:hypothetical protein
MPRKRGRREAENDIHPNESMSADAQGERQTMTHILARECQ